MKFLAVSLFLANWVLLFSTEKPQETADIPSLRSCLRFPEALHFCGEIVPLDSPQVKERMEKEMMISVWDRPQVMLWLKRSSRYFPVIEARLRERGMPGDLKFIAVAESALRPHIGSPKGALGFWQFMKVTGRNYGLTITEYADERRNIYASTDAALDYLHKLHEMFGSWTLAAAAYNMGEEGLKTEILLQNENDYYQLYLPMETQRYIFRILSVKLIMSDPVKYGFILDDEDYYQPLRFDRITIQCEQETPIRLIAEAADASFKSIKDLNPELRGYYLPEGNYSLAVPEGSAEHFHERFLKLNQERQISEKKVVYIVKKGDNLYRIAEKYNVPLKTLMIWNRLELGKPIHPGDRLIIYLD